MDTLLEKSKIDDRKLYKFIKTTSMQELSNLSEPCYYPKFRKYKSELLRFVGLSEKDLKEFPKRFYKGTKWSKFQLHNDDYTNLLLFIMHYFLKNNNELGFSTTLLFYNIRQYSNVIHKLLRYCNEEIFKYSLENLPNIHLFKREKTIGNAIYFLSKQYSKTYKDSIKNQDVDKIGKFIQESRHRINQSLKSFVKVYYKAHEEHESFQRPIEISGEEIEVPVKRGEVLIDKFVKKITVYKQYDRNALDESLKESKIKKDSAVELVKELGNNKYNERLNIVLKLLLYKIRDLDTLCSDEFKEYVRKLITIKRTREKIYFKQQINELLIDILKSLNKYDDYEKMNNRNKFFINMFLAYYISLSFKNYIC